MSDYGNLDTEVTMADREAARIALDYDESVEVIRRYAAGGSRNSQRAIEKIERFAEVIHEARLDGYERGWIRGSMGRPPDAATTTREAKVEEALRWIAAQACRHDAGCDSIGACITEKCETCYARAALASTATPPGGAK